MKFNDATRQSEIKDEKSEKLLYSKPCLRVHGSVSALTKSGGSTQTDSGSSFRPKPPPGSDRRIKDNIVRIGSHPLGIGLYLFDYKPAYRGEYGEGRQFGVMADEVEAVMPTAVAMHPVGYKTVCYAMLGISRAY